MSAQQSGGVEQTRRAFLTGVAAGTLASASSTASAQAETFELGGEVAAWHGRAPASIEGQENPTLQLQAGQQYQVTWENLDGQPHNFTLWDGNENVIVGSDDMSQQGQTQTFTFTASPEMAQYVCTIHPTTMIGEIQVQGGAPADGDGASIPVGTYLFVGAVLLAFVSPLLFALFLFTRGTRDRTRPRG